MQYAYTTAAQLSTFRGSLVSLSRAAVFESGMTPLFPPAPFTSISALKNLIIVLSLTVLLISSLSFNFSATCFSRSHSCVRLTISVFDSGFQTFMRLLMCLFASSDSSSGLPAPKTIGFPLFNQLQLRIRKFQTQAFVGLTYFL